MSKNKTDEKQIIFINLSINVNQPRQHVDDVVFWFWVIKLHLSVVGIKTKAEFEDGCCPTDQYWTLLLDVVMNI